MQILFLGPTCPAIETCLSQKEHTFVRTEEALTLPWVQEQRFVFGLSYRYKKIIRQEIIDFFAGKLINMHISLLPWNRGYDPNLWSYIENTPRGVTIHRIDAGIDTGDILLQQEVSIDLEADTLRTSYDKLSRAMEKLFIDNAEALLAGAIPAIAQAGSGSFHYAKDKLPYVQRIEKLDYDMQLLEIINKLRGGGVTLLSLFINFTARLGGQYRCAA